MKAFYAFLLLLCPYTIWAQSDQPPATNGNTVPSSFSPMVNGKSQTSIQPVKIGDKVPAITFTQMVNSKSSMVDLAAFKGKLIILDFWATWCSACTRKLSFLDSMQQRYPAQLQVILVNQARTKDDKLKIEKFFNRHRSYNGGRLSLPTAYNDTMAGAYFPNRAIPHYVWISPSQLFLAATGPDELTGQNLLAALDGKTTGLTGFFLMDSFNRNKPLFVEGNAGNGEGIMFRSTLSSYISGMGSFAHPTLTKNNLVTRFKMINTPLLLMLTRAYNYYSRHDRIVLSVNDSVRNCLFPLTDSAARANTFSYEFITPPVSTAAVPAIIAHDLQQWFGLAAKYEFRPAPAYLLTIDTMLIRKYQTRGGKLKDHLNDPDSSYIINGSLPMLANYLNYRLDRFVLQKDSIRYNLDLALPPRPGTNCGPYIAALASMGIILIPAIHSIEQFIIYQLPKQ